MLVRSPELQSLCKYMSFIRFEIPIGHPHYIPDWGPPYDLRYETQLLRSVRKEIENNILNNDLSNASLSAYKKDVLTKLSEADVKLREKKPDPDLPIKLKDGHTKMEFELWLLGHPDPDERCKYPTNIADQDSLLNYYLLREYPWALMMNRGFIDEIERLLETFSIPSDNINTNASRLYIHAIKSQHLQIACHTFFKYFQLKQVPIEKKIIADILASTFKRSDIETFAPGKLITGSKVNLKKEQMEEVAQVFYDLANLISDEIDADPENGYFSKG